MKKLILIMCALLLAGAGCVKRAPSPVSQPASPPAPAAPAAEEPNLSDDLDEALRDLELIERSN